MSDFKMTKRALLAGAAGGGAGLLLQGMPAIAQTTALRWATVLAPNHPEAIMMERIVKQVRETTAGGLDIQTFPGGQLGTPRDTIEATSTGAIQLVNDGAAQFGQFVPQISILEAPYIWRDHAHLKKALASPFMQEINAQLVEKRGMRIIGGMYNGRRHVTSGKKEIRTLADMKGFKLRIPEVDLFRAMVEAWGATPTPLNITELYLALSQGAVDGQENPLPTIQANKFNEVQKFLILTGHIITPRMIAVNEKTWAGLSAKNRDALSASILEQTTWQDNEILSRESELVGTFKAGGMTVIEPDVAAFRKVVLDTLPAKFEARWGKGTWDRLQAL